MSRLYRIKELMKKKQRPLRLHSLVCVGQQQNTSDCVCRSNILTILGKFRMWTLHFICLRHEKKLKIM